MSQLPRRGEHVTDPVVYAQSQLALGVSPETVAARVGELYPGLLGQGSLTVVDIATQALRSGQSASGLVSGASPVYAAPPTVATINPGATQFDVRFTVADPKTGRQRTIIIRDTVYGPLTREALLAAVNSFLEAFAVQYGMRTAPVAADIRITSLMQGPTV